MNYEWFGATYTSTMNRREREREKAKYTESNDKYKLHQKSKMEENRLCVESSCGRDCDAKYSPRTPSEDETECVQHQKRKDRDRDTNRQRHNETATKSNRTQFHCHLK